MIQTIQYSNSWARNALTVTWVPIMEADKGEKSSRFRCLNVARYVVAAVMTVLIVFISLNTAKLVIYERSRDPINLWVVKGFVYVRRSPPALMFYLALRVSSDRGFKYYSNITGACLCRETWPLVNIICFDDPVPGRVIEAMEQQAGHYILMQAEGTRDGSSIGEVMLLLNGTFIAEQMSGWHSTTGDITYSCTGLYISDRDQDKLFDRTSYDEICRRWRLSPGPS